MKLKNLSILASVVVIGLSATSFAVKAEANKSNSLLVAQEQPGNTAHRRFGDKLGLSDTQKAQIQAIMKDTRAKMDAVLTPQQLAIKQAARQNRQAGKRGTWKSLNLTQDQKNQLKQIRESSKTQILGILTPEQKQKWEQMHQGKHKHHHQQTPTPSTSPS